MRTRYVSKLFRPLPLAAVALLILAALWPVMNQPAAQPEPPLGLQAGGTAGQAGLPDGQPPAASAVPAAASQEARADPRPLAATVTAETAVPAESTDEPVQAGATTDTVGQWALYEIVLTSTVSYAQPFTEVEVYADFESQDRQVRVYGFHDGNGAGGPGNLWKIRFMTGEPGLWSWQTQASDATNSGLHQQVGAVSVVSSTLPGPIQPDPDVPNAWQHANGEHFYWNLGYSIHMLGADRTHPGVGGWQDYLDWLERHGFNGVMFTLQVPSFQACSTCREGMAPWSAIGNHPPPEYALELNGKVDYFIMPWASTSGPGETAGSARTADFTRFYLPFWLKVDQVVAEMQQKGMISHVLHYDDQTFWPPAGSAEERLYWDYLLRRLGAYWNVVFNDGIDLAEYRDLNTWVNEWQQYFAANDPFNHARSSRHGNDDLAYAVWRSVQAANATKPTNVEAWRTLMQQAPRKPVTEDDGIRARVGTGIDPDRFMQLAWWSVLSGPGGFGATWSGAYDPGNWYANLDAESEGMRRVAIRISFMRGDYTNGSPVPFWRLAVRDDLVNGEDVYCSAIPGELYLVYFDAGSSPSAQLDLAAAAAPLPISWLNPRDGTVVAGGETEPGQSQTFTNPFNGPAVLVVGLELIEPATPVPPTPTPPAPTLPPPLATPLLIPLIQR